LQRKRRAFRPEPGSGCESGTGFEHGWTRVWIEVGPTDRCRLAPVRSDSDLRRQSASGQPAARRRRDAAAVIAAILRTIRPRRFRPSPLFLGRRSSSSAPANLNANGTGFVDRARVEMERFARRSRAPSAASLTPDNPIAARRRALSATGAVPAIKPEATAIRAPQDGRWKITVSFDGRRFCVPKCRH